MVMNNNIRTMSKDIYKVSKDIYKEKYGDGCEKCDYEPAVQVHAPYFPGIVETLICKHCCADKGRKPFSR